MRMAQEEAERLARQVADLGLMGDHWLLSDNERLRICLTDVLPPERLRVGTPGATESVGGNASVVLLDPEHEQLCDQLIEQLRGNDARPLLILISQAADLSTDIQHSLRALGYRLPASAIEDAPAWRVDPGEYDHKKYFDVAGYWEQRYSAGRDSGSGSHGRLARFKAQFLNRLVEEHDIHTVVEFGCGDGAQLGLARYIEYVGLDISRTAVDQCRRLFRSDDSKRFEYYDPENFDPASCRAELSLSLDVIYHLANDRVYELYLEHLFATSSRYVVIYSNTDRSSIVGVDESASYMRFRNVLEDINRWFPDWSMVSATANRFPFSAINPRNTSISDFFVFEKLDEKEVSPPKIKQIIDRMVLHKTLNAMTVADENTKSLGDEIAGNRNLLQQLDKQIEKLSRSLGESDDATRRRLRELVEGLGFGREQSLSLLSELQDGITQNEEARSKDQNAIIDAINRCNEILEQHVNRLQRALDEKQQELDAVLKTCHELSEKVVPQLEDQLSENRRSARKDLQEVTSNLAVAQEKLRHARQHEIPGLKRKLEIEQRVAERALNDLKSSATWQVGTCFREAAGSLRGLIRLPISLLRVWRNARRSAFVASKQSGSECRLKLQAEPTKWIELGKSPIWLNIALKGSEELAVMGRIKVEPNEGEVARCGLVRIEYLGDDHRVISGHYAGANFSRNVGHYKYLRFHNVEESELFRLRPPKEACAVRLGFQSWQFAGRVEVANGIRVVQAQQQKVAVQRKFQPPSAPAQEISILGWPAPPDNGRPLVLSVMDEFTEGCFEHNLRLLQPRPDNWYALAQKYPPVMAFIESAWKGNGGSWQYRVGSYSIKPGRELEDMMTWAREVGVPSIFWNKEDPVHHEKFMGAASLADHVFTTDENMIDSYKRRTGNSSVHALPFAAQPALHKPAALDGRIKRACFAGSWYGDRHVERGKAMKWLLQAALKHGLDIFDRNHGSGNFPFPVEYQESIRGGLPYRELCREYARYRLFLNVNSVTDSPTMFSRRVFELMACGTPVVSTYSRGMEELFESDAVWLVRNEAEADEAIHTLLTDDTEWRRRSLTGIREIFSRHTYAHRINRIFETIGVSDRIETEPSVLLLARVEEHSELDRLLAFAEQQTYRNFELLVECSSALNTIRNPANVHLVREGELQSRTSVSASSVAAIGWVGAQHQYGPDYLRDLVNAKFCQPDALGWAKATGGDAFRFGAETHLMAAIWQPEEFVQRRIDFPEKSISSVELFCVDAEEFNVNDSARPARQVGCD